MAKEPQHNDYLAPTHILMEHIKIVKILFKNSKFPSHDKNVFV